MQGGYFFPPTVITDLPVACRVNREEIFGPVVTITPFDSEEEVIGYANDTEYGLASSVWTQNLSRAHRVAEQIHTGTVWVNCWLVRDLRVPFGGMKQAASAAKAARKHCVSSPSQKTSASQNDARPSPRYRIVKSRRRKRPGIKILEDVLGMGERVHDIVIAVCRCARG